MGVKLIQFKSWASKITLLCLISHLTQHFHMQTVEVGQKSDVFFLSPKVCVIANVRLMLWDWITFTKCITFTQITFIFRKGRLSTVINVAAFSVIVNVLSSRLSPQYWQRCLREQHTHTHTICPSCLFVIQQFRWIWVETLTKSEEPSMCMPMNFLTWPKKFQHN